MHAHSSAVKSLTINQRGRRLFHEEQLDVRPLLYDAPIASAVMMCLPIQHKEPKLDMAKRVISGPLFEESWIELDDEVRAAEARRGQRPAAT